MSDISQDDREERREPELSAPPEVPQFAAAAEVPRFAEQPQVPRFAPPPGAAHGPGGAADPADAAPAGAAPASDDAPAFIAPPPAPPAPRWTSRLALAGVAVLGVAAVAAGLSWFSGQRKVDRSLEVLAMSARPGGQAGTVPPQADTPALPAVTAPPSNAAAAPPAQPAAAPLPPLVTLPPVQAAPKTPVPPALVPAVARPARGAPLAKPVVKGKPKAALRKVAGTKPVKAQARGARSGATALAPKPLPKLPQRAPCKRGDLARECLGLPDN